MDGFICGSSAGAVAISAAIASKGRRVGHDIDLITKQPANLMRFVEPAILTVNEDIRLAGSELAKAVLARIDGVPSEQLQSISQPDGRLGLLFQVKGHHEPEVAERARLSFFDVLRGRAFERRIPLPKGTPIELTLDSSLNFDELVAAYADAWRRRVEETP